MAQPRPADRAPRRRPPRLLAGAGFAMVVAASMGASCSPRVGLPFGPSGPSAPVVLSPTPTSADIVAALNQNAGRVVSYQAGRATVSMPEMANLPLVSASIAAERPSQPSLPWRFRLRAVTALTGPEIDLGSNDERFWMWARRNEPPAIYTARHDQWATSPTRGQLPIEPSWVAEALGMVTLDPGATYQGPFPRGDGGLELRTQINSPTGVQQRVLVVDAQTAQLREQHVYDAAGTLIAGVLADRFRFDPVAQASLPERVRLSVPAAQLALTINTGPMTLNAPIADGGALWSPPDLGGYPTVDLAGGAAGLAQTTRAWDLAGATAPYRQPDQIATTYGERTATPEPQTNTAPPSVPAATFDPPPAVAAAPSFEPVSVPSPKLGGFVGLPANGRVLGQ